MRINSQFVLNFYSIVTQIYDFFSSVWAFFFNNTVSTAFATLGGNIYILFEDTFIGEILATLYDMLYVYLIRGTFIGDMNMLLFTCTTAITLALAIGFAKFFNIKG